MGGMCLTTADRAKFLGVILGRKLLMVNCERSKELFTHSNVRFSIVVEVLTGHCPIGIYAERLNILSNASYITYITKNMRKNHLNISSSNFPSQIKVLTFLDIQDK